MCELSIPRLMGFKVGIFRISPIPRVRGSCTLVTCSCMLVRKKEGKNMQGTRGNLCLTM